MKRNCTDLLLLLWLLLFLSTGCSETNPAAPGNGDVHHWSISDPRMAQSTVFHGTDVNTSGTESCKTCHGADLAGSGAVAGCTDCHFDLQGSRVPSGSGWVHGLDRHGELLDSEAVCVACHETLRRYTLPPETCHNCHGSGTNHVLGQPWLDKTAAGYHGGADSSGCADCHRLADKCVLCHFGAAGARAPAGSNWNHGSNDAHRSYTAEQAVCNRCHDLNRSYGNGPAACHDCHAVTASHELGRNWLDKTSGGFHGDAELTECGGCHDLSAKCAECHFGTAGSKAPPGSGWNHGNNEAHRSYRAYQDTCNRCHNLSRSYGNGPDSCHDCHDD